LSRSDDLSACANLVRRGDPDRFLAVMAAPVAARAILFPIYAMNVEVARAPWVASDPLIAEMRLQWWRDALDEIASGGSVRRHEVVTPLAGVISDTLAARLDPYVAARRWDCHTDAFEDLADFLDYIDKTAGTLLWAAAGSLGDADEAVVRDAGFAQGLANWFRAIPALEARGRKPLPDGRPEAVAGLAATGLERLARARSMRGRVSAQAKPAMLAVWQAEATLKQALRNPAAVGQGALQTSEARKKIALMARAFTGRW
jgi:phytoene/squalene synthetase